MSKRGYKLQEFVAHGGNVNCLSIGKKNFRQFLTGGDDQKVNLWSIGKATSLANLCGHTSPVESVAFDSEEILVVAGSSSGAIKLWDLEETKTVRTLTGHRSYCTALQFHPFGDIVASGSMDTNLKIWDTKKKGCIHTYKGHTRGISTIRFTPDGRWVVSGGFDNVVKVWDLTAGKLLHDFKCHEGHIRSIDFHPLEFLLATGSADKTVKFWDLETFEMIGSAKREAAGVRSIAFHPDGRTLFCGLDNSLKVYSWEPVICRDSVDMGWSVLGDLCIHDGKLLGGAYYENSVAVWVSDISLIEPYGASPRLSEEQSHLEQKYNSQECRTEKEESHVKSKPNLLSTPPDIESKEIKNIYVDCVRTVSSKTVASVDSPKVVPSPDPMDICTVETQKQGSSVRSVSSKTVGSVDSPKVVPSSDPMDICTVETQKQGSSVRLPTKTNVTANNKNFVVPRIVPRGGPEGKDLASSRRVSNVGAAKSNDGVSTKPPHTRRLSSARFDTEKMSGSLESVVSVNRRTSVSKKEKLDEDDNAKESSEGKHSNIDNVAENFVRTAPMETPSSQGKNDEPPNRSKGGTPVRYVNGVAVRHGRTRSLVERFERRELLNTDEILTSNMSQLTTAEPVERPPLQNRTPQNLAKDGTDVNDKPSINAEPPVNDNSPMDDKPSVNAKPPANDNPSLNDKPCMSAKLPLNKPPVDDKPYMNAKPSANDKQSFNDKPPMSAKPPVDDRPYMNAKPPANDKQSFNDKPPMSAKPPVDDKPSTNDMPPVNDKLPLNDDSVIENLMQNHDILLSTYRSRLTKLQVVRHFWERNDVKGAINAVRKLPDHSVQADVVSVLIERMEIFTLDLFSCLLPVLVGLLESQIERHASVSLEILLKLVAVFGSVVRSAVSAPPSVGVDLHAEERIKCCKQCFTHLQNIQKILPQLVRRGGVVAKCAQQLNLVLQQT